MVRTITLCPERWNAVRSRLIPLAALLALAPFTGCQSPHGAAELKRRHEARKVEEAGFAKWRSNYLQASERLASAPAWVPPSSRADAPAAERKNTYSQVKVSVKVLALTFDDGPHATYTPRLLDILKRHNAKATFFVLGQNAREYPDILRRMAAEGHEIANHSWSHAYLPKLNVAGVRKECAQTRDAIVAATGSAPKLFRPPYGATNTAIKSLLWDEFRSATVLWSVDPLDWKRPGVSVVTSRLVNGAHPGAILLAHDIHGPTIDAMPATLERLSSQGYRFVTVSQLIAMEEVAASVPPPSAAGSSSSLLAGTAAP